MDPFTINKNKKTLVEKHCYKILQRRSQRAYTQNGGLVTYNNQGVIF